jgi:hypothetical protein
MPPPVCLAKQLLGAYVKALVISVRLLRNVDDAALRSRYRLQLLHAARFLWRNPHMLFVYAMKTAMHPHYAALTQALREAKGAAAAMPDATRSFSRSTRSNVAPTAALP